MSLLQIQIDEKLKKVIKEKAKMYGVPASSLVKIVLTNTFLLSEEGIGNIFNASRDNNGEGITGKNFLKILQS